MSGRVIALHPPGRPIEAVFTIPGSKSYTNRALIMAALAAGESLLRRASMSRDSEALCAALELLGVNIRQTPDGLLVKGRGRDFVPYHGTIDVGPAGTTMRFLTALCSFIPGIDVKLCGSERMHMRPIAELVAGLRQLGAEIEYLGNEGCPPLRIRGKRPAGGTVRMDGSISSQYFTALLLIAPLFDSRLDIQVCGDQTSRSYIDMTLDSMRQFGLRATNNDYKLYTVEAGQTYRGGDFAIEGDASGASYLWGLAALSGGVVRVQNLNPQSAQGDIQFPRLLKQMGCGVEQGQDAGSGWIEVRGAAADSKLAAIEADMSLMPDTAQTLAVIAAVAAGNTKLSGLHTLKIKETDRIVALKNELAAVGIHAADTAASLIVHGGTLRPGRIKTYDDHRMAMAFAMLGSVLDGIEIEDPQVVEKSFPEFWEYLAQCGIRQVEIGSRR